ncbi:hypothetical protein G6F22_018147 [Rhizopus arrhizus]|nr:hypothetical protein G6F22_018147 [Rhizopus arrhizus]
MHQPVALALGIHGDMAASGHVQHGLFTDPDRPGIGLGHVGLLADARFLNRNMPAPGVQPAQHGDLVGALDLNGATRVDADPRAFAHDDRPALRGPVRVQRQVGADADRTSPGWALEPGACAVPPSNRSTGMATSICAPSATASPW